ncbi:MAG: histidine phosphatase family protein, partial [Gammaproteobacteria bacterium]|nr:histidine phosphatase family protein [Gammaproteobacteria bacterium]
MGKINKTWRTMRRWGVTTAELCGLNDRKITGLSFEWFFLIFCWLRKAVMGVVVHIIAMRHGQSEYNILGLCNDDPERQVRLTLAGRRQAEIAGQKLRQVPLQHILCSQLPRAHET